MAIRRIHGSSARGSFGRISDLYVRDIRRFEVLPKKEQIKLVKQAQKGNGVAMNDLMKSNLFYVITIANLYKERGVPFSDLVQEGNKACKKAIEKFNETKGASFLRYAYFWIRQAISSAIITEGSHSVWIPVDKCHLGTKVRNVQTRLFQENGEDPTAAQIAERIRKNFSEKSKKNPTSKYFAKLAGVTTKKVEEAFTQTEFPISLETPVREKSDKTRSLADLLKDETIPPPDEEAFEAILKQDIEKVLSSLPKRERTAVVLRFGLKDNRIRTLREVGKQIHLTRERARQIIENVIYKKLLYSPILRKHIDWIPHLKDKKKQNAGKTKKHVSKTV